MRPRALVVVGASAGGVEALSAFTRGLPKSLDAAVCVVLHIPNTATSALPQILDRAGDLPAAAAADDEVLRPGRVYVAPADLHLLVVDGRIRLSYGPTENGHRPAIDPLFRSAAHTWGPNTIGVVLSGTRDDGAAGLFSIAGRGGSALVQEFDDALYSAMPRSAVETVPTARLLPAASMGTVIEELVDAMPVPAVAANWDAEDAMASFAEVTADETGGVPAGFGCPSCHGALFELPGVPSPRYRCRVGHAWSAQTLMDEQGATLEGALWMALRSLAEKAALSRRMAASATARGNPGDAARHDETAVGQDRAVEIIRDLLGQLP